VKNEFRKFPPMNVMTSALATSSRPTSFCQSG